MDITSPQYDSFTPPDERHLQALNQHYREGTPHLEIEEFERRRHEVFCNKYHFSP